MRNRKSHADYFVGLFNVLLREDMVRQYGDPDFARDFQEIENRVKNEGFSFLTKTLPILGKAVDNALTSGTFSCPRQFQQSKGKRPRFLSVLFRRVFDADGSVKVDPCISAVNDLRQILYLCYKYEVQHDETIVTKFLKDFRDVDTSLDWQAPSMDHQHLAILSCASTLLHDLFVDFDPLSDFYPGHGPGAVATGEKNWEKMNFSRKYNCIHQVYPYYTYFYTNAMDLASRVSHYKDLEAVPTGTAKVVLVPKDSRGPRLISMEPLEFQWVQQGLSKLIVNLVETHKLTRGHVNFRDQEINRRLALEGSYLGNSVTLDMKEASDRVSLWLVKILFSHTPILKHLLGTRTEATELPTGEVHLLRKFAPMGSALCFPIEALVHWSLSVASLHVCNRLSVKAARRATYVYGDDIIIKGQNHKALFDTFPHFKLRFNEGKCCTTGIFRESCGMDAVLGLPVTPLKMKKPIPSSPYDATGFMSYIEYCNTLWNTCYYSSSKYIENDLKKIFGHIPHVLKTSDAPGFYTQVLSPSNKRRFRRRWNRSLMRFEWRVQKIRPTKLYRPMNRREYLRKQVTQSNDFVAGIYSVPRRVNKQQGWSPDLY